MKFVDLQYSIDSYTQMVMQGCRYNITYTASSDEGHSERGQTFQQRDKAENTLVYTLYRKSPLKEDNLSTKDKMAGPESVLIKRFHCTYVLWNSRHKMS